MNPTPSTQFFVPSVLATTATLPLDYRTSLFSLITAPVPIESVFRGSESDFANPDIELRQVICNKSDFVKVGLADTVLFLKSDPHGKCVIFTNSKIRSFRYLKAWESKLNKADVCTDLLHIHGSLKKHDKLWRI